MANGSGKCHGSGKCLQHGVNNGAQGRSIEHPKTVTKQGQQSSVQQLTKHKEKRTGSYGRNTAKDTVVITVSFENRREHHCSKTKKIGNEIVRTECYKQVVRSVKYHKSYKSGTTCCSTKNKH